MNKRIKELAAQAAFRQFTMPKTNVSSALEGYNGMFTEQEAIEKFAELIVRECAYIPIDMWDKAELNADVAVKIEDRIKEHFGVEETKGWVCPRCGVDRTKTVCPKGYTATIEGKCPMIGVAQ